MPDRICFSESKESLSLATKSCLLALLSAAIPTTNLVAIVPALGAEKDGIKGVYQAGGAYPLLIRPDTWESKNSKGNSKPRGHQYESATVTSI